MRRLLLVLFGAAVLGTAAYAIILEAGWLDVPLDKLEAKYRLPQSKFMVIDGVRVHYTDEGEGPPIVLVHASYMSLHSWNQLTAALRGSHRVIRLDLLTAGLTGTDPRGRYSVDRNVELLEGLTRALHVDSFALLGTSSGAIVAFRYAARHPEQVTRLILANAAGMPRTAATNPNRARGSVVEQWIRARYRSQGYWRDSLRAQFASGQEPPESLVERVYDMNRRSGLRATSAAFMANFSTGDPEAVLAVVRAPTLILWGLGNITVSPVEAEVFEHWLVNAPSMIKKYKGVGHYMYLEIPDEFARDVSQFLSGSLDADLRVTRRVPAGMSCEKPL
jgi:pimeloyl-ACP methyl ester carboxylesterase